MARVMPLSDITSLDERIFPYLMETLKVQCNHQIQQSLKVSSVLFPVQCCETMCLHSHFRSKLPSHSKRMKYCWHKYNRMCRLFIWFLKVSLWGQQTNLVFVREDFYWKQTIFDIQHCYLKCISIAKVKTLLLCSIFFTKYKNYILSAK